MFEIRRVAKNFDGYDTLTDFSLTVPTGSFTVLIGPSGCGKSTLFRLLMGVLPRDGGSLVLDGIEVPDLRGRGAYMAQKDLLLPWRTLLENALLPVMVQRIPSEKDRQEAAELFDFLGLSGFGNHYPRQVSGGMAQRCALARTILFRAPLALLDEPLSAVDAITRHSLRSLLLSLQSRFGKTILMVTHDVDAALLLADRIVLLSPAPMRVTEVIELPVGKPRDESLHDLRHVKGHILSVLERGDGVPA